MRTIQTGAAVSAEYKTFEEIGVLSSNTAAQNKAALQAAIDELNANSYGPKTLYGRGKYPIEGVIYVKPDVTIQGNAIGMKGGPNTATWLITDTVNNVFKMQSRTQMIGWNWYYPNQPLQTTTPATSLIVYPAAVMLDENHVPGKPVRSVRMEQHCFIGGWSFIDFSNKGNEDIHFENLYGYPLGGTMAKLAFNYDIAYWDLLHVNPGMGRDWLPLSATYELPVSSQVLDYVIANGQPSFDIDTADEFVLGRIFAFGVKTALKIANSYGSVMQLNADIVETIADIAINEARKTVQLGLCSGIPSGGPTAANRNGIKFSGAGGTLIINGLGLQLGTNAAVPSSGNANANAGILVNGTGTQRLVINSMVCYSGGTFTHDVQKANSSAVVEGVFVKVNNATNKVTLANATNTTPTTTFLHNSQFNADSTVALASYTPETGSAWTVPSPVSAEVVNTYLRFNTGVSNPGEAYTNAGATNVVLETKINALPFSAIARLIARKQGTTTAAGMIYLDYNRDASGGGGVLYLKEWNGTTGSTLAQATIPYLAGAIMKMTVNGTSVTASYNGTQITGTCTYTTGNLHGIGGVSTAGNEQIDYFTISDVPAS